METSVTFPGVVAIVPAARLFVPDPGGFPPRGRRGTDRGRVSCQRDPAHQVR